MGWPQYTYIAYFAVINTAYVAECAIKRRTRAATGAFLLWLLWCGGFFGGQP